METEKITIAQEYAEFVRRAHELVPQTDDLLNKDKGDRKYQTPFGIYQKHLIGMITMYTSKYGLNESQLGLHISQMIEYIEKNAEGKLPKNWAELTTDIMLGKYLTVEHTLPAKE